MNNIIALIKKKNEARVDSKVLAEQLGIHHKNALALIDANKPEFEEFGRVAFETRTLETKGGKQKQRIALLNEDQSYFLLTLTRNNERTKRLKVELVKAFSRFRQHQQSESDYLPFYHELHDQVKALSDLAHQCGSNAPERVFHININKLINEAFGLKSGQRPNLPGHMRAKVTAANVIAKELLEEAIARGYDHKAAHLHVKQGVKAFANASVRRLEVAA